MFWERPQSGLSGRKICSRSHVSLVIKLSTFLFILLFSLVLVMLTTCKTCMDYKHSTYLITDIFTCVLPPHTPPFPFFFCPCSPVPRSAGRLFAACWKQAAWSWRTNWRTVRWSNRTLPKNSAKSKRSWDRQWRIPLWVCPAPWRRTRRDPVSEVTQENLRGVMTRCCSIKCFFVLCSSMS